MITELQSAEIEKLLHEQFVGRIGCVDNDCVYMVPISYAYDGQYIYCHSFEGKKISLMRKNPRVCFQVDLMKDMGNWKSVIVRGKYEELKDKNEINKALKVLLERPLPAISSITTHLGKSWPFSDDEDLSRIPGVVFRISAEEKSGKTETTSESPMLMFS